MAHFPDTVYIVMFFFVADNPTRLALRAATSAADRGGNMALAVVQARLAILNGVPSPFPDLYIRMNWWAPWVGHLRIYENLAARPAARARFAELWAMPMGRCIWVGSGTRAAVLGLLVPRRMVEIHGNSSHRILWQHLVEGRGWVPRSRLYDEAMLEDRR